jgi:hypothetical protein
VDDVLQILTIDLGITIPVLKEKYTKRKALKVAFVEIPENKKRYGPLFNA